MTEHKHAKSSRKKEEEFDVEPYLIPGSILLGSLIVAGSLLFSGGFGGGISKVSQVPTPSAPQGQAAPPSGQQGAAAVHIANVKTDGEPFVGKKDAPVTLAYWGDYQCPFCKRFDTQTLPSLISSYVDTGKLRVVFKDFQFLSQDSTDAGMVGNAVWELYPQSFFDWHQAMFEAQDEEHGGFGNLESILQMIREDLPKINADRIASAVEKNRDRYAKELAEDKQEGGAFGITGTPGFIIGTQKVAGAQPTDVFVQLIEQELNK